VTRAGGRAPARGPRPVSSSTKGVCQETVTILTGETDRLYLLSPG